LDKSPDAFRTISEAADELDLPQHVLRFWETRFSTIKPMKRGGGRRYYRPEDVLLLRGIRHLLYDQGFTIRGVQRILKDQGVRYVVAIGEGKAPDPVATPVHGDEVEAEAGPAENAAGTLPAPPAAKRDRSGLGKADRDRLTAVLRELLDCKRLLERAREG
jgi:DNA-binding transcriptional MerR regulator